MNLRFNEGAIVMFTLFGCATPVTIIGKVAKVLPDEVELISQLGIYRKSSKDMLTFESLDYYTTADSDERRHVNRQLIQDWRYAKVTDLDVSRNSIYEDDELLNLLFPSEQEKPFSSYTLNHFDPDGYHRGNGPYCGEIKAAHSGITFTPPTATADDGGMSLELTP